MMKTPNTLVEDEEVNGKEWHITHQAQAGSPHQTLPKHLLSGRNDLARKVLIKNDEAPHLLTMLGALVLLKQLVKDFRTRTLAQT
eukprot:5057646-Amphidinium_carterae.1